MEADMKPKDILEKEVPKRFQKEPDKVQKANAVIDVVVTGKDGGTWTIDCTKKGGEVRKGPTEGAKLTVTIADTDFIDIFTKKLSPQSAFFQGKLKVKGDIGLALKLGSLIS